MPKTQTPPLIADIQTTDLLYYDPAFAAEAYQFCLLRDIDCLPCLDDLTHFYLRSDETLGFDRQPLTDDRRLSGRTSIFQRDLLERFSRQPMLFVFENDQLTGAVHFSDYNKPLVSNYLYTRLAAYERDLRRLAELAGLRDEDMGRYFRDKLAEKQRDGTEQDVSYFERKFENFEKRREQRAKVPLFQAFFLEDLLRLLKHNDVIVLQGKVVDLRNAVMHARDPVNMVDASTSDYIYDFDTFATFFKGVRALLDDSRRVANRLRFLSGDEWAAAAGIADVKDEEE